MNPLEQQILKEEQQKIELEQAQKALSKGLISQEEYDLLLKHDYGLAEQEKTPWALITAVFAIFAVFSVFALWGGTITGLVVFDMQDTLQGGLYTDNTQFVLEASNTTTIRISGWLQNGSARIQALYNQELTSIWEGEALHTSVWTDKKSYAINETISVIVTDMSNYTLWLIHSDGSRTPTSHEFSIATPGEYVVQVLSFEQTQQIPILVRDDTNNTIIEERIPQISFNNACDETCEIRMSNPEIIITLSEGATLNISEFLTTRPGENTAPAQTQELPIIVVNQSATIDLDEYFIDPNNEGLTYDISISGVDVELVGSRATFTRVNPGLFSGTLYVSDLREVITATITVEVLGETIIESIVDETPTVNETINITQPIINETINITEPTSNESMTQQHNITTPSSCEHPNINMRPPECFGDDFALAFQEVTAPLRDLQQNTVGRFTRLGNLVIRGVVVEESTSEPGANDFKIGFTQRVGFTEQTTTTAWIDSSTGDLHLRGRLIQEQLMLQAPQYNSYVVSNANGIILAYFDRREGDLYLQGHVVQLGNP